MTFRIIEDHPADAVLFFRQHFTVAHNFFSSISDKDDQCLPLEEITDATNDPCEPYNLKFYTWLVISSINSLIIISHFIEDSF